MKKFYFALLLAAVTVGNTFGQACTIDAQNTDFFNPDVNNVPCVEKGVAYNETLQMSIPDSIDLADYGVPISYILYVDSIVLDSITGLPAGLTWASNPANGIFFPGNACGITTGTTNVDTGNYPLIFHGLAYLHGTPVAPIPPFFGGFDGDTTVTIQQLIAGLNNGDTYSVDVINPGDQCRPVVGVKDFSSDLNTMISVYPNPSNGVFEVKMNAGRRINGQLVVTDFNGKMVYSQNLDVIGLYNQTIDLSNLAKGLYTVQLRTAEGFTAKNISIN